MIRLVLEPQAVLSWQDFVKSKPNFSIALDGYVKGPPQFLIQGPYANLAVTIAVAVITVCVNLVVAVLIGIAIASGLFVVRMGRSIVKRKYVGDQIHSKKERSSSEKEMLTGICSS